MAGRSISLGQRWLSGSWLMGPAESRWTMWRAISLKWRRIFDSCCSEAGVPGLRQDDEEKYFARPRRRLTRRLEPLFRQQPHRRIRVHRLAERKPLGVFAAELIEFDRVAIGLVAFRDDLHA